MDFMLPIFSWELQRYVLKEVLVNITKVSYLKEGAVANANLP